MKVLCPLKQLHFVVFYNNEHTNFKALFYLTSKLQHKSICFDKKWLVLVNYIRIPFVPYFKSFVFLTNSSFPSRQVSDNGLNRIRHATSHLKIITIMYKYIYMKYSLFYKQEKKITDNLITMTSYSKQHKWVVCYYKFI